MAEWQSGSEGRFVILLVFQFSAVRRMFLFCERLVVGWFKAILEFLGIRQIKIKELLKSRNLMDS